MIEITQPELRNHQNNDVSSPMMKITDTLASEPSISSAAIEFANLHS